MANSVILPLAPQQLAKSSSPDRGAAEAYEPQVVYKDYTVPRRYKELSDEDWDEYDHVQAKKIRDLNRQRDHEVELIKKGWRRSKDLHMKALTETPYLMTWTDNSGSNLLASNSTFPMINVAQSNDEKKTLKLP